MSDIIQSDVEALRPVVAIFTLALFVFPMFYYFDSLLSGMFFFLLSGMFFLICMVGCLDFVIRPVVQWHHNRGVV